MRLHRRTAPRLVATLPVVVALALGAGAAGPAQARSRLQATTAAGATGSDDAARAPSAPGELTARPYADNIALSWVPGADGGSPVIDFVVETSTDGEHWAVRAIDHYQSTATTRRTGGFSEGTTYFFRVAAVNAVGTSAFSEPLTVTTGHRPAIPTSVLAVTDASGITVSWAPSEVTGAEAVTSYSLDWGVPSTGHVLWTERDILATSYRIAIDTTKSYFVRVSATNTYGSGRYSANLVTTAVAAPAPAPPPAPVDVPVPVAPQPTPVTSPAPAPKVVVPPVAPVLRAPLGRTPTSVRVAWTAGADRGAGATDAVLQVDAGTGAWRTVAHPRSASAAVTVAGLVPGGAYRFRVALRNSAGLGALSAPLTARTPWVTRLARATAPATVVRKGAVVRVTSRLTYTAAGKLHGAARTVVVVEFDPAGPVGRQVVGRVRTGADGRIAYALRATASGTVRFHELGGGILAATASRAATVRVR